MNVFCFKGLTIWMNKGNKIINSSQIRWRMNSGESTEGHNFKKFKK